MNRSVKNRSSGWRESGYDQGLSGPLDFKIDIPTSDRLRGILHGLVVPDCWISSTFMRVKSLSGKRNTPPKIAELIDKALEAIIDQWYLSVSDYYITTEKKTENPEIFGPPELKRFHDENGHRIKFDKGDLDFTYGLNLMTGDEGCALEVSVNNKVPNFNYTELSVRLANYYQTNSVKAIEGFKKIKNVRNCDVFQLGEDPRDSIKVETREGKADIVRMSFDVSDEYLEELVLDPANFMELIHQYCVAPLRRIYAEVYRFKRK
jgi:hypothetical protein